jgi:4-amino-4-deoxy-L-arabinose transferase-like glycosyltransferase
VFRGAGIVAEQGIEAFLSQYARIPYLGRQHPPLTPIVHGLVMQVLGVTLLSGRLVSLVFFIGAMIVVYFIGRELFGRETGLLGALVLLSFPLVGRLGTAGQMDIHLLFFFTLSLLAILRLQQRPSLSLALLTGLVIGLGLLTKYLMVLIFPVLGVLYLIRPPLRRFPVHLAVICLVAGAMLGAWLLYANSAGILNTQRTVIGVHTSYVVSNDNGVRWMLNSLLTKLPSAIGLYNIPLVVIGGWAALRRREERDLFLLAWIVVIGLILTVTLPDHRYFMLTFPALAILIADWLKAKPALLGRVVLLQLLFAGGVLFFMVHWLREAELFVR